MPRSDRIGHPKKRAFLAAFAETGNISLSCQAAGVRRSTYYEWTEHDGAFGVALAAAREAAIDKLEEEARRRAVEGVTRETGVYHNGKLIATEVEIKYSDTLLIFLLKGLRPEKYRERMDVTGTGAVVKVVDRDAWEAI